ncbi:MAG: SusC/RagA family TonB-linked outer membrane protein [Tannerellaceae bacterium]|jgi:TonB-linked SusC/RagA family outer membrane protein|nr:SusC/RagA family TonB-linked outer membrane protein [Tannerellaceae bacterium]
MKNVFINTLFLLLISPTLFAQITVNVKNQPIRQILSVIERSSDYKFFYNDDLSSLDKKSSLVVENATIDEALNKLLVNTEISYKKENESLIVLTLKSAIAKQVPETNQKKITGIVLDESGEPIVGANIIVKGAASGIITDINGQFQLEVPQNAVLIVSYIGYNPQEISVKGKTFFEITLTENIQALEEVLVVGYGTIKKRDMTGSVSQLSSSSIQNQAVMKDPIQALQGKIAGADITMGNAPGSSSTILIRGYNSINAGNSPLIVVDDAPFAGKVDEINPAEIESIDILKDASSTAIYGSRGANGVIIITTKRARKDSQLTINYDGYAGVSKSFKNYDMMSGEKYADWKRAANQGKTDKEIFDDIQLNALNTGQFTDWQDLMFGGTGYKTDHNISINQSAGHNRNMLVLGYNKDQSIIDNMNYERFSARINGDMELAKNFTIGYSSLLALTTRNNGDNSVWKYGTVLDPLTEVYDENGEMRFYNSGWYQTVLHSNPMFDIDKNNVDNKEKRTRILLNLFADWEIISGLKFRTSLTYGMSAIENGIYRSATTQARQLASPSAEFKKTNSQQITFTNLLNYKKILEEHSFDVSLVHDMQTDRSELVGLTGQDMPYFGSWYNVNEAPDVFSRLSSVRKWTLLSFMGRINYSFKDRYLLTLTGRYDGSSRLADGNKWDFFPSAALAWRINEEAFLYEVDWLSNLKLRLSWGNSGNTAIAEYATQGALGRYVYYFGTTEQSAMGYLPTELPNNQLGWERTEEYNAGIDFGFLNNRINGSIDGYIRNTHDLLMQRNLPVTTGYEFTWQNVGKMRNSGIEVVLNTVPVVTKDFRCTLDFTFGYNKNEIVELFNGKEDSPGNKWFIGQPLYVEHLYKYAGVWQYGEETEAAKYSREPGAPKVEDVNKNDKYDQDDLFIYNRIPKWTAGFSTGLYYKDFDLNIYFYTRQKYGQILGVLTDEAGSTRYNHLDVDFWTPDNPTNACPKPAITNQQNLLVQSDYAYRDLSFIRLKNINLGYTLPKKVSRKFHSERFRVYFMVENPYTWTKSDYVGLDPENCNSYTDHRPLTSFVFGINASF